MRPRTLALAALFIAGCGTTQSTLDRPYASVVADLKALYPVPRPYDGNMEHQIPAYRADSAGYRDVKVDQREVVAGSVYTVKIFKGDKFSTWDTLVSANALDANRTQITIDTEYSDSFFFETKRRDWQYQQDRLAEIKARQGSSCPHR